MRRAKWTAGDRDTSATLAGILAGGPMKLAAALECATQVGTALREIHEQGRAHGKVGAAGVSIRPGGAELIPSRNTWEQGNPRRDVREFGGLLFHMLTGVPLKPGELPDAFRGPAARVDPAGVRTAVLQVAGNCFREGEGQPSMQQVLTELRLFAVLVNMKGKGEAATPAGPPFLVSPVVRPLDAHAGAGESGLSPVVRLDRASFGSAAEGPQADVAPRGGPCPKCECVTVYVSRPRSRFESLLVRLGLPLCRCHRCYHRYFVFSRFKMGKEMPVGAEGAKKTRRPHRRRR